MSDFKAGFIFGLSIGIISTFIYHLDRNAARKKERIARSDPVIYELYYL